MSADGQAVATRGQAARRRRRVRALTYAVAVLLSLFVLVPIYLITVTAFTPRQVSYDFPKPFIPGTVSAETVRFFADSTGVMPALWRSVLVAAMTLVLSTLLGAPAGYALARFAFRGKSTFRLLILSTRAFPIVILSIPLAVTFITWGISDTTYAVALMHTGLALPFTILITSSIFVSVPRDLEEAARTLGCTPVGAFVKVVLPLALPGLAAAAIFTFVLSWNEVFAAAHPASAGAGGAEHLPVAVPLRGGLVHAGAVAGGDLRHPPLPARPLGPRGSLEEGAGPWPRSAWRA
jgi:multiple sugar transport system permease protein